MTSGIRSSIDSSALAALIRLDRSSTISLQDQIRRGIVNAISSGAIQPGTRLPSSRKLAEKLEISRNTPLISYQKLIADGHLNSRQRSGVFVADRVSFDRSMKQVISSRSGSSISRTTARISDRIPGDRQFSPPPNWQSFRFPFLEGCYDRSLFPIAEWREASRLALAAQEVNTWSIEAGEADDPALVDEIRTKLLPRRGIAARPDEILITAGEQQALFLAIRLLGSKANVFGVEEPGLPEVRALLQDQGARLQHLQVDDDGLVIDDAMTGCEVVIVSSSRQRPTAVTLSGQRRKQLLKYADRDDVVIIEDDFECELNYLVDAPPALRALDRGDRVVYVASLSRVLEPGVGLGFMVASPEFIAQARRLRSLMSARPSPNNQRAAAFFLSLGHYDAMLRRLSRIYEQRLIALRDALNHYRPLSIAVAPVRGGTTYWVRAEPHLSSDALLKEAQARGVLIEPVGDYYAAADPPKNIFRLGVTSLPAERIRDGIAALSEAMLSVASQDDDVPERTVLSNSDDIVSALSGATLHYRTVYGEPCTIWLDTDGGMRGVAGTAGNDSDVGRWWTEDGLWFRQWHRWAFGETLGFRVAITGNRLSWLDESGRTVDGAVILDRP